MGIVRETELSAPVKSLFESLGYEVKSEVNGCDLVAHRSDLAHPVIIELKKTFSMPLLLQAIDRQKLSPSVYLAVEKKTGKRRQKDWRGYTQICKKLGVGLITVQFYRTIKPRVEICCDPVSEEAQIHKSGTQIKINKRKSAKLMAEFHARTGDYNIGGSYQRQIMTAYREQSLYFAYIMREQGTVSPKTLRTLTGIERAGRMLQQNVYGWFERVDRGVYQLTKDGEQALQTYNTFVKERFK